jgi:hypothetical protein
MQIKNSLPQMDQLIVKQRPVKLMQSCAAWLYTHAQTLQQTTQQGEREKL